MIKNFINYTVLVIVLNFQFLAHAELAFKDYTNINCGLKPRVKFEDKGAPRGNTVHYTRPHIPVKHGTSTNWSGYAVATNLTNPAVHSVTQVHGTWNTPKISKSAKNTYCSIWVGIDGFTSGTVEQIGTEHDWVNGRQSDYAWFEMYPNASFQLVGFPLSVGDSITGSVVYVGSNVFVLSIRNNTKKVMTVVPRSRTVSAKAQGNSAEWIVEAPFLNSVLPLANFGTVKFTNCSTVIKNVTGGINNKAWKNDNLKMITNTGAAKAVTSALSTDSKAFSVVWKHE